MKPYPLASRAAISVDTEHPQLKGKGPVVPDEGGELEHPVDTEGSAYDTLLAVYTGNSVSALTEIESDDDSGTGLNSFLQFTAVNGTTYYIAIDGYSGGFGAFVLNLS